MDRVTLALCGELFGRAIRSVVVRHDSGAVWATLELERVEPGAPGARCDEIVIDLAPEPESSLGFEVRQQRLSTVEGEAAPSLETVYADLGRLVPAIIRGVDAVARAESVGLPWVGDASTAAHGGTLIGDGWTEE